MITDSGYYSNGTAYTNHVVRVSNESLYEVETSYGFYIMVTVGTNSPRWVTLDGRLYKFTLTVKTPQISLVNPDDLTNYTGVFAINGR